MWVRADEDINQRVLRVRETMIELAELQNRTSFRFSLLRPQTPLRTAKALR